MGVAPLSRSDRLLRRCSLLARGPRPRKLMSPPPPLVDPDRPTPLLLRLFRWFAAALDRRVRLEGGVSEEKPE